MIILVMGETRRPPYSASCWDQDGAGSFGTLVYICVDTRKMLRSRVKDVIGVPSYVNEAQGHVEVFIVELLHNYVHV